MTSSTVRPAARRAIAGAALLPLAALAQTAPPRPAESATLAPVVVTATRTEAAPFDIPASIETPVKFPYPRKVPFAVEIGFHTIVIMKPEQTNFTVRRRRRLWLGDFRRQ